MNVKEKLIRIRETVVSINPPENTSGILWIKYSEGADNPFSFYLHDGIEWNPVAITATGGAELSQSQIEAIRKASKLVIDGSGLNYLSDDGTYKPLPYISVDVPTRLSQLVNDCGFITSESIPTKTSQLVNDSNFSSKSEIPTKTSQLANDSGFLTEHQKIKTINGNSLIGEGNITIEGGSGESIIIDSTLSDSSINPVQNKVVTSKINELETSIDNITDKVYNESFVIETGVYTKVDDTSGNYTIVTDKGTINKCIDSSNKNPGRIGVSVVIDDGTVLHLTTSQGDDSKLLCVASVTQSTSTVIYQLLLKKEGNSVLNKQEIENVDTSNYYTKEEADTKLSGYVLKIDGKSLSTNDYTDADKDKVGKALTEHQSLGNYYTKEEVDGKVAQGGTFDPTAYYNRHDVDALVGGKVDKVEGKSLSSNDYTDDDKAKVALALTEHQDISGKQDVITDLEAIRSGAAKGATALQSYTESDPLYAKDKPNLALKSEIPDVSGLAKKSDIPDVSGLVKSTDLAEVATSGDYDDLMNKPSIPSAVTEQTVSGWGFAKQANVPTKTSQLENDNSYVSYADVAETLESLQSTIDGKVDKVTGKGLSTNDYTDADKAKVASALQSFTETDPTVPSWAKQTKKPSYTAAEVGALPSTTKIPSKTSDLSNDSGFLTEHQTLKTINGNSLVGEGDLTIEGGGSEYDITSIFNKTAGKDSSVEITADEYNGLLEAVNAGKVVKYAASYDEEDLAVESKSSRYVVITSGGQTDIYIYFVSNLYVNYFTVAKSATGACRAASNYVDFLTKDDPDLSGAYYNLWNTNIGLAILETPVGSYQRDVSSSLSSSDFNNLKIVIDEGKIIKGIDYASATNSGITIRGTRENISGYIEFIDAYIANVSGKLTITRKGPRYANGHYALEKVTGKSSTTITLDSLNDRVCYYVDDMSSVTALTASLNRFNDDGSVNYDQPKEWMIQFIIPSTMSTLPSVTWPSSMRWANGEVLSLEAGYTYEFHIVATRLGCTVVGQKFKIVE